MQRLSLVSHTRLYSHNKAHRSFFFRDHQAAVAASLRFKNVSRTASGGEAASGSLGSSATVFLLEIAVVLQTLAVVVTW